MTITILYALSVYIAYRANMFFHYYLHKEYPSVTKSVEGLREGDTVSVFLMGCIPIAGLVTFPMSVMMSLLSGEKKWDLQDWKNALTCSKGDKFYTSHWDAIKMEFIDTRIN